MTAADGAESRVERTVLPNGVRVLSERIPGRESVALGVWVEAGSRYERPEQNGISHFLEHLFFKGTERRTAREIAQAIDGVGGVLNAFTDREYTCYHARVLRDDLPLALDVLSDVFLHARFPADEIERERTVVLSEISEGEDTPDHHAHVLFDLAFWPGDPLSRPIAGTAETVGAISRDDLLDYVAERYRPDRVIVAAAGAVEHGWLVERIERSFGGESGASGPGDFPTPRPALDLHVHEKPLEQVQMLIGLPGLPRGDERRYAAAVLNTALGDGMSSRLFQEIREERGLAYSVSSFLASYRGAGYWAVYAGLGASAVGEALAVVRGQLCEIRERGLEPEELARAKSQLRGSLLLGLEATGSRMSRIAINEIHYGRQIAPEEVSEAIGAVTEAEVHAIARDLFSAERLAVTLLGPLDGHRIEDGQLRLA